MLLQFHLSLKRPMMPLILCPETPRVLAKRSRRDSTRRGRKVQSSRLGGRAEPALKMMFREAVDTQQRDTFSATTPPTPVPLAVTEAHYPGWRSRRHSITAHNAPSRLSIAPPTHDSRRRLSRRFSIGLAVSPDETRGRTAFPATIMYAKIVSHLEKSLEPGRHFHRLQRFSNCFFGHSMVDCLLTYCLTTLHSSIKREKAVEMCRRMLGHGVIENVSHRRQQDREGVVFKGSRLYRFTGNHFWEETTELVSNPKFTHWSLLKQNTVCACSKYIGNFLL